MENIKKLNKKLARFFNRRKFRYGGISILLTVVVIAAIILVNVAFDAIESNWALRIDLTAKRVTSLADATVELLGNFDQEVRVYTVYRTGTQNPTRVEVEAILEEYRSRNRNIVLGSIDPVADPVTIARLAGDKNLSEGAIIVTNADESKIRLITPSEYSTYTTNPLTGGSIPIFAAESKLTSAILFITSDIAPKVYVLKGHDEMPISYLSILTAQLANSNYIVAELDLTAGDVELEKGDTVIVVDPARDISSEEYDTLSAWLASGGRLLMAVDFRTDYSIEMSKLPNFTKLLGYYQLGFGEGVIVEDAAMTSNWSGSQMVLVPNLDAEHEVTAGLAESKKYLRLQYTRPVKAVEFPESGIQYGTLLTSSALARVYAMGEDEPGDPGTQIVGMTAWKRDYNDEKNDIRIALLGSLFSIADNDFFYTAYNLEFTTKLIDWLANYTPPISVSATLNTEPSLSIPGGESAKILLAAIVIGVIPLLVAAAGLFVWLRRRRL